MKYQELIQDINKKIFRPVYLFTGPEQYIATMMEKRLIKAGVTQGTEQFNTMTFSDSETNIADITAICRQLPMMSEYRIVIVKEETNILHTSDATIIDALCEYLKNPEPSTCLILYDNYPDKRKKIWKTLTKTAAIVEYSKLTQPELEKWIARRLKIAGKTTKRNVVEQFIDNTLYLVKENQTIEIIDNELDKIINYIGNKEEMTLSVLNEIMPQSIDDNIFKMIDCIMENKNDAAIMMLKQFYLEGESPFSIFGLLINQLRTLLHIKILFKKRIPSSEIAKAVSRPPFIIKKMQTLLQHFTKHQLIHLINKAAKMDLNMKTGVIEPELGLTLYILNIRNR